MSKQFWNNPKTKTARLVAFQLFLMAAWFFIGWRGREVALLSNQEMIVMEQARQYILNYEDYKRQPISESQLTQAAIRGMINDLDDPRAVYFEPEIAARVQEDRTGFYAGIGMSGDVKNGRLYITDVNLDEPAANYGLLSGDIVLEIDGYRLRDDMRYEEISVLIRGKEGTTVTMVVLRDGEELTFTIPRKASETVTHEMLNDRIGYISLNLYTKNASEEMYDGLTTLLTHEPSGLIWDLRGNGGGSLTETVQILDYFIDGGTVMYVESKSMAQTITYTVNAGGIAVDVPLVVLIDDHSYSAPETTAAAGIREAVYCPT